MVTCMLMNEEARALFQKAFIMSSPMESFYSEEEAGALRDSYLEGLGIRPEEVESLLDMGGFRTA